MGGRIKEGLFFTRKCIAVFARRPKKSGRNNEVAVMGGGGWGGSLYI